MVNLFFIKYTYPKFHPIRHVTLTHTNAKLLLLIVFALVFIVIVFWPKRAFEWVSSPSLFDISVDVFSLVLDDTQKRKYMRWLSDWQIF